MKEENQLRETKERKVERTRGSDTEDKTLDSFIRGRAHNQGRMGERKIDSMQVI